MLIERYEAAAGEFPGSPAAPLLRIVLILYPSRSSHNLPKFHVGKEIVFLTKQSRPALNRHAWPQIQRKGRLRGAGPEKF